MGQDSLCLGVTLKLFPSDTAKQKSHFPRGPRYKRKDGEEAAAESHGASSGLCVSKR